jgi:hypothetical protein
MDRSERQKNKMHYRPDGWKNPCSADHEKDIFEAGADAMLQMLIKEARDYGQTAHHYLRHDDYLCDVLAEGIEL